MEKRWRAGSFGVKRRRWAGSVGVGVEETLQAGVVGMKRRGGPAAWKRCGLNRGEGWTSDCGEGWMEGKRRGLDAGWLDVEETRPGGLDAGWTWKR